jgi:hypothetical protein
MMNGNKTPAKLGAMQGYTKNNLEDGNLTKQYVKGKNADYSLIIKNQHY